MLDSIFDLAELATDAAGAAAELVVDGVGALAEGIVDLVGVGEDTKTKTEDPSDQSIKGE